MAAHVDTRREGLGPFFRLREVRKGSTAVVTTSDGRRETYRVSEVRLVDKAAVDLDEVFRRHGPETLVLVTCGGQYDQDAGYRGNVLVTASPQS